MATTRSGEYIPDSFQMETNMIVAAIFLLIMKRTEFRLVRNREENCQYDHFHFNLKVKLLLKEKNMRKKSRCCCSVTHENGKEAAQ